MNEEEEKAIKTIEEFRDYYAREDIHKEDFNNNQSYEKALSEIRQLRNNFDKVLNLIIKLQKENEELNNRCRNLDKEAQAYLEELAGDNTLTRRTIKQLQEENEELKKDYYNVINKIENKIDILDIAISECIYIDDDDKAYKKAVKKDKLCLLNQKRALQELLEGGE